MFCASVGGGKSFEIKIIQFTFVQSAKKKKRMLGKEEILGDVIFFFFAAVAACGMFIYLYMYI